MASGQRERLTFDLSGPPEMFTTLHWAAREAGRDLPGMFALAIDLLVDVLGELRKGHRVAVVRGGGEVVKYYDMTTDGAKRGEG